MICIVVKCESYIQSQVIKMLFILSCNTISYTEIVLLVEYRYILLVRLQFLNAINCLNFQIILIIIEHIFFIEKKIF